jgi:hypothetical protein
MRPQLEQRLSIVDFRHFRSRRKAIEGWRENGAGFSAAGRSSLEATSAKRLDVSINDTSVYIVEKLGWRLIAAL